MHFYLVILKGMELVTGKSDLRMDFQFESHRETLDRLAAGSGFAPELIKCYPGITSSKGALVRTPIPKLTIKSQNRFADVLSPGSPVIADRPH
jgi:hypothetical protein